MRPYRMPAGRLEAKFSLRSGTRSERRPKRHRAVPTRAFIASGLTRRAVVPGECTAHARPSRDIVLRRSGRGPSRSVCDPRRQRYGNSLLDAIGGLGDAPDGVKTTPFNSPRSTPIDRLYRVAWWWISMEVLRQFVPAAVVHARSRAARHTVTEIARPTFNAQPPRPGPRSSIISGSRVSDR